MIDINHIRISGFGKKEGRWRYKMGRMGSWESNKN